jgi:hypothetical protein
MNPQHYPRQLQLFLAMLVLLLLTSCAQLGVPAPDSFKERTAAAIIVVSQVRMSVAAALRAKSISISDAENTLKMTDAAHDGIMLAWTISSADPARANATLTNATMLLTALQRFIETKAPKEAKP